MIIMVPLKNVIVQTIISLPKVMETLQTKEHEYTVKVSKSPTIVKLSKSSTTHILSIQTKPRLRS